jgi:phosphomannomutase
MTLIKSISGIRGTIGGKIGDNLTPIDVVKFTSAYAIFIKNNNPNKSIKIVVGRDARISGEMVSNLIVSTLVALGVDVVNIGLATTPTTEMSVVYENAQGGIIITASHNPKQWNALKLLNEKGEFLNAAEGEVILKLADSEDFDYACIDNIGHVKTKDYLNAHIESILKLPLVDVEAIRAADFKIAIDAVNSVGGIAIPVLLEKIGISQIIQLNCDATGNFAHNPEPLPENLTQIAQIIATEKADLGFVVDPDVDRLAILDENGNMFGEEYTLVAVADYVLSQKLGNTVSNLSSSRALRDVTKKYGTKYSASAVGEVNVVAQMKATQAVIGGEGNGGIIYPELHYGRDSLVGIALFLTHLAKSKKTCSQLRAWYPNYFISKNKIELTPNINVDELLIRIKEKFQSIDNVIVIDIDGVKIDFENEWVHLRKSNTEPIIRIYAESINEQASNDLAHKIINEIYSILV